MKSASKKPATLSKAKTTKPVNAPAAKKKPAAKVTTPTKAASAGSKKTTAPKTSARSKTRTASKASSASKKSAASKKTASAKTRDASTKAGRSAKSAASTKTTRVKKDDPNVKKIRVLQVAVTRQGGKADGVTVAGIRARAQLMLARLSMYTAELSVLLTNDQTIHELNLQYRGKDRPTDVLAFAMNEGEGVNAPGLLGDVVISLDTATRQAASRKRPVLDEVTMLLAHGLLHLLGYDHAEPDEAHEMRNATRVLVRAAKI